MALAAGTRIGPHEIVAHIAEGGMGQVYRARDTKLDRDVALTVLPESFIELVQSPTLADRIAQGPLPLDEALTIADQIAQTLQTAHDQGIVPGPEAGECEGS